MFKWFEKYFTFSRMERNGIVALLTLSVLVLLAPKAYFYFKPVEHMDNSKYKKEIEAFVNGNNILTPEEYADTIAAAKDSAIVKPDTMPVKKHLPTGYFEFDPNKIGIDGWMRLGFTEKQAQNIEKYKAKGGKFYRAQDLMRLWDMNEEHYYKLKPYVKIDVSALPKRNYDKH